MSESPTDGPAAPSAPSADSQAPAGGAPVPGTAAGMSHDYSTDSLTDIS